MGRFSMREMFASIYRAKVWLPGEVAPWSGHESGTNTVLETGRMVL
jgi:hypothetical protein